MKDTRTIASLVTLLLWSTLATLATFGSAQQTSNSVSQGFTNAPFTAELWAGNVTGARGMVIDDAGDVLVVATGLGGIYALWEEPDGQVNRTMIVNSSSLNHGITLHGNYLYASSPSTVWRWNYKAQQRSEATGEEIVVQDIDLNSAGVEDTQGHVTRSLAINDRGILFVSVGSTSNVDTNSFRARIRSFSLTSVIPNGGFNFVTDGTVFADGLRNEVGLGFDGKGRLWGVENGADNLDRADLGGDIHDDNPAEELNLFNGTVGTFYGYPFCWSEYNLTKGTGRGSQWVWPGFSNGTITDAWCKNTSNVRPPELAMQAHSAPLGVTFFSGANCGKVIRNGTNGTASSYSLACEFAGDAFVSFHGSWDRDVPTGFKVVRIGFDNSTGLPAAKNGSATFDIFGEEKPQTECVGNAAGTCLRPVDVKFDKMGALMVTSDATGEIIRVTQTVAAGLAPGPGPSSSPSPSPPSPSSSSSPRRLLRPIGDPMTVLRIVVSLLVCILGWSSL